MSKRRRRSLPKSTDPAANSKPKKPYPDYPLFWHPCGGWTKKIRGRLKYFGKIPADQALKDFNERINAKLS